MTKIRSLSTGDFGAGSPGGSNSEGSARKKTVLTSLPSLTNLYQFLSTKLGEIRGLLTQKQSRSKYSPDSSDVLDERGQTLEGDEQGREGLETLGMPPAISSKSPRDMKFQDVANISGSPENENLNGSSNISQKGKQRKESKMTKQRLDDLGNTSVGSGVGFSGDKPPIEDAFDFGCDNPRFRKKKSGGGASKKKKAVLRSPIPPSFQ